MREGEWKLLMNPDSSRKELYRIPDDPSELNNLAADYPERTARMAGKLIEWYQVNPDSPDKGFCIRPEWKIPGLQKQ